MSKAQQCPKCGNNGTIDDSETDDKNFVATWFFSCIPCNWQWDASGEMDNIRDNEGWIQ